MVKKYLVINGFFIIKNEGNFFKFSLRKLGYVIE